jgi:hypothetical protein
LHPFLRFHSRARLCLAFDVAANINELGFRRTILVVLLFSGASLAFA